MPYTTQQARLGRPVSPHVTIYKQPLTAITSILTRVTGLSLTLGFGAASAVAAAGGDVPQLLVSVVHASPALTPVVKFVLVFPLTFHTLSGVRHHYWDRYPDAINLRGAPRLSAALLVGAVCVSLIASAVTIETKTTVADRQTK